ncbi:MAG TPA: response regulator [Bacillota bacterium]|nr:response regulator [Bacillota bacterium]
MRILIAEDDMASRKFLYKFLSAYGDCDLTVDGVEAIDAYTMAWDDNRPYDLICLDIMMPNMDGYKALETIRALEKEKGVVGEQRVKIIMTTALNEPQNVFEAFDAGCEAYAAKPINTEKFIEVMQRLGLV